MTNAKKALICGVSGQDGACHIETKPHIKMAIDDVNMISLIEFIYSKREKTA